MQKRVIEVISCILLFLAVVFLYLSVRNPTGFSVEPLADLQSPMISFVNPTWPSGKATIDPFIRVNISIADLDLNEVAFDWNGVQYEIYDPSLVLMMNMNNRSSLGENNTRVVDLSRYGNNGTANDVSLNWIYQGRYGHALLFNTFVDQSVIISSSNGLNESVGTLSLWAAPNKWNVGSSWGTLFAGQTAVNTNVIRLQLRSTQIRFSYMNNIGNTADLDYDTSSLTDGEFHHFAATWVGSQNIKLYLDGELVQSSPISFTLSGIPSTFYLGREAAGSLFNGTIDEVRLWNRNLSADEVREQYYSNLYKHNQTQWYLYVNQTAVTGLYTYQGLASDLSGNVNATETRNIGIGISPFISFVPPTPLNGSSQSANAVFVNISTLDESEHSAFIDLDKSLAGYWAMDWSNFSGIHDNSTHKNFAKFQGELSANNLLTGKRGRALNFNGSTQYLTINDSNILDFDNTTDFSVEFWIKPSSSNPPGSFYRFLHKASNDFLNSYNIDFEGSPLNIRFFTIYGNFNVKSQSSLTTSWQHVAIVIDRDKDIRFYINGTLDSIHSNTTIQFNLTNAENLQIGKAETQTAGLFNGSADEIRIWKRILSPEEISASFNAGTYQLSRNFTNLTDKYYELTATVINTQGNLSSLLRSFTIDASFPILSFFPLTPQNGAATFNATIPINVSIIESDLGELVFHWNKTNYTLYDDSLVLMLNLNNKTSLGENLTQVIDVSKYVNHGQLQGGALWNSSGKFGGGIELYGNGSHIDFNVDKPSIAGSSEASFFAWVKMNNIIDPDGGWIGSEIDRITGDNVNWQFFFVSGNTLRLRIDTPQGASSLDTTYGFLAGKWYHLGFTYNSSEMKLFINGIENGEAVHASPGPINDSNFDFKIGYKSDLNPESSFNGSIDEVKVWNRTLSEEEILEQYYSNLFKYNQTQWYLNLNQSNISVGNYSYFSFAEDRAGNVGYSEIRQIAILPVPSPAILFAGPTPLNNSGAEKNIVINANIIPVLGLKTLSFTFNSINSSFYDDSLMVMLNLDNQSVLGENATFVKDLSRYGNDGSCSNSCPNFLPLGKYRGAFSFNGINSFIDLGNTPSLDQDFTSLSIEFWINANSTTESDAGLVGKGTTVYGTTYHAGSFVYFYIRSGGNQISANINQGIWHHIVGVFNGSILQIYVDGISQNIKNSSYTSTGLGGTFYLGKRAGSPGAYFNGSLDEVRVWNRSLSNEEVKEHYASNLYKYNQTEWRFESNQSDLNNGISAYSLLVKDSAGSQSLNSRVVNIFNPVIIVNVISPGNNSLITSPVIDYQYNLTSLYTITNCSLILDSTSIQNTSAIINGINAITFGTSTGKHTYAVKCIDNRGNLGISQNLSFQVLISENQDQVSQEQSGSGSPPSGVGNPHVYYANTSQLKQGYRISLARNDAIKLAFLGKNYTFVLRAMQNASATFQFNRNNFTLSSESIDINLDEDNIFDITMTLERIINNSALVYIKEVKHIITPDENSTTATTNQEKTDETNEVIQNLSADSPSSQEKAAKVYRNMMYMLAGLIIFVVFVIAILFYLRSR